MSAEQVRALRRAHGPAPKSRIIYHFGTPLALLRSINQHWPGRPNSNASRAPPRPPRPVASTTLRTDGRCPAGADSRRAVEGGKPLTGPGRPRPTGPGSRHRAEHLPSVHSMPQTAPRHPSSERPAVPDAAGSDPTFTGRLDMQESPPKDGDSPLCAREDLKLPAWVPNIASLGNLPEQSWLRRRRGFPVGSGQHLGAAFSCEPWPQTTGAPGLLIAPHPGQASVDGQLERKLRRDGARPVPSGMRLGMSTPRRLALWALGRVEARGTRSGCFGGSGV